MSGDSRLAGRMPEDDRLGGKHKKASRRRLLDLLVIKLELHEILCKPS